MEWASEEMKGDRELCTAAVADCWSAYQFASDRMRDDIEVAIAATQTYLKVSRAGASRLVDGNVREQGEACSSR